METDLIALIVSEIAEVAEIAPENIGIDTALADLGLDSLQALQLLVTLEKALHIELDEADLAHFANVRSIVEVVNKRLSLQAAA
jgi:acyl carrier protein